MFNFRKNPVQPDPAFSNVEFEAMCNELKMHCFFPLEEFIKNGVTENDFQPDDHYTASGNKLFAKLFAHYLEQLQN